MPTIRPVVEKWGPSYSCLLEHEETIDLLREIATRATTENHRQTEYGDLEVVWIQDGRKFLDFLSGGREAMLEAKANGLDIYDLTDEELACVEQLAGLTATWRDSLGEDGSLRIYVD
jgi:hypothetical protein